MKAIVYEKYGPPEVLKISEIDKPVPKEDEVLIRIHSATVTAGDWRMRKADPFPARLYNGLFRPKRVKVLGFELSGQIEATGENVTLYKPGDSILAFAGFGFGAYAEFICLPEKGKPTKGLITHKPESIGWEEAAAIPVGGLTAMAFLRKAGILHDPETENHKKKVLVFGASGSVGTYAVQLARYSGVTVTGVCSTGNVELVKSLGAERVIDYTDKDFTCENIMYDVIFDAVGKLTHAQGKKRLRKNGSWITVRSSAGFSKDDLDFLCRLVGNGKVKPVIDRTYTMEEIVEAHHYVESFRKKGNVVLRIKR